MTFGEQALRDVRDETFVSKFWDDLVQGVSRGKIPKHFFRCYHITPKHGGGYSYKQGEPFSPRPEGTKAALLISIKEVFPAYEEQYRLRTGQTPPLSIGDIVRSIQAEPYWIPPQKNRKFHQARANGVLGNYWAISLEEAPKSAMEAGAAAADLYDDDDEPVFLFTMAQSFIDAITTKDDKPS